MTPIPVGAFLLILSTQSVSRVSVSRTGGEANGPSGDTQEAYPGAVTTAISTDGRFVAFVSEATNLTWNIGYGVYVRDRLLGTTEKADVDANGADVFVGSGTRGISMSSDGRYVAFFAFNGYIGFNAWNVFRRDRSTGITEPVSLAAGGTRTGDNQSEFPSISADGRYVAFLSYADDLIPGGIPPPVFGELYVRDMTTGITKLVSVTPAGAPSLAGGLELWVSASGRYVAFASDSPDLVPNDGNLARDVFIRDRELGTTELISTSASGVQGNDASDGCVLTEDGRFAYFTSRASNLVPGILGGHVYRKDRRTGAIECIDRNDSGQLGNGACSPVVSVSPDGRWVAFASAASNFVTDDRNSVPDIFLRDCLLGTTTRISSGPTGRWVRGESSRPCVSANGRIVAFASKSRALTPPDTNGVADMFAWDRGH